MKKILFFLVALILLSINLNAQNVRMFQYSSDITGACQFSYLAQNITNGKFFYCKSGSWSSNLTVSSFTVSSVTITQGTLTTDAQGLSGTVTWNSSGVTFTTLKYNVTDTASASGSLLLDLQVGGSSKFKVGKSGASTITDTEPRFLLSESDQAADEKLWDIDVSAKVLNLRTRTDADGAGVNILTITRGTGTAVLSVHLPFTGGDGLYVDRANGNVGIGTATPTEFNLTVAGTVGPESDNNKTLGDATHRFSTGYFGTALAVGTNVATVGQFRVASGFNIVGRDVGNTADYSLFEWDSTNIKVELNPGGGNVDFKIRSDTNANLFVSDAGVNSGAGGIAINNGGGPPEGYTFYVGAGTSGINGRLYAANLTAGSAGQDAICRTAGGEITVQATSCAVSSRRYKENINDFNYGLEWLTQMKPVTFDYIETGETTIGLIAEDLDSINSLFTARRNGQVENFHDRAVIAVLINSIKELNQRIEYLENRKN